MYPVSIKQIVYAILFSCVLLLFSCHNDEGNEPYVPVDEITSTEATLIPDKDTKAVSAVLTFKNLNAIDYLIVKKSGGDSYSVRIEQADLSSPYVFKYTIQKSDPESFKLLLRTYYNDGNMSNELSLNIDNRRGFFIRNMTRVARITGTAMSGETFASPNNTAVKWNVGGTDLGIVWEMQPGKYGIFFWRYLWT